MVPNNFQIELKGLPTATSQFTGVKHVTHRETGWENSGSKETGLEYDGFIVYVHFLNLGNLELELSNILGLIIIHELGISINNVFLKGQRKCKNTGRGKVKHYDVWDAQGILTKQGDTL